jgi:amino-acid N-acetyltransferase
MTIDKMHTTDLPAVHALLRACRLPVEGLAAHVGTAIVARENQRVVGVAALELYPPYALLRSVAVDTARRDRGAGQLLTAEAIALARRYQLQRLYLLTETASAFFPRLGFSAVARSEVPREVQRSVEFTSLCPDSAVVMTLDLTVPSPAGSHPEMT